MKRYLFLTLILLGCGKDTHNTHNYAPACEKPSHKIEHVHFSAHGNLIIIHANREELEELLEGEWEVQLYRK